MSLLSFRAETIMIVIENTSNLSQLHHVRVYIRQRYIPMPYLCAVGQIYLNTTSIFRNILEKGDKASIFFDKHAVEMSSDPLG